MRVPILKFTKFAKLAARLRARFLARRPAPGSRPRRFAAVGGVLLAGALCISALAQSRSFIFDTAPFAACHASTIVQLKNGQFRAAWFGGTAEGKPDVAIWSSYTVHGVWTAPAVLVRERGVPTWNPVLFHSKTGRLWLYYKFGPSYTWWTAGRLYSDDDGAHWSTPQHLPAGLLGPIRTKPLLEPNGNLISGSSVESYGSWAVWIERSTDNGFTWTTAGPVELQPVPQTSLGPADITPYGIIQPTVIALGPGDLRLYARSSAQIGSIVVADSHDDGRSWSPAHRLSLPNPNSGIDVVKLKDGRVVLIYNHTTTGRTPLNLAVSRDGEHFRDFYALETEPGEFSYPAMIQGSDGNLHITYTWKRRKIRYVVFPLAKIPN